jgi:hypothetical protein
MRNFYGEYQARCNKYKVFATQKELHNHIEECEACQNLQDDLEYDPFEGN